MSRRENTRRSLQEMTRLIHARLLSVCAYRAPAGPIDAGQLGKDLLEQYKSQLAFLPCRVKGKKSFLINTKGRTASDGLNWIARSCVSSSPGLIYTKISFFLLAIFLF